MSKTICCTSESVKREGKGKARGGTNAIDWHGWCCEKNGPHTQSPLPIGHRCTGDTMTQPCKIPHFKKRESAGRKKEFIYSLSPKNTPYLVRRCAPAVSFLHFKARVKTGVLLMILIFSGSIERPTRFHTKESHERQPLLATFFDAIQRMKSYLLCLFVWDFQIWSRYVQVSVEIC